MSRVKSTQTLSVPNARGGPVTDWQLEQGIQSASALQGDLHSMDPKQFQVHFALVCLIGADLFRECLARRRAMGVIEDMTNLDNVTLLPSH